MEDEKRIENPGLKDCNCKLQSALQTFSAYPEEQSNRGISIFGIKVFSSVEG